MPMRSSRDLAQGEATPAVGMSGRFPPHRLAGWPPMASEGLVAWMQDGRNVLGD